MFKKALGAIAGTALMASASVHAAVPAGVSSAVTDMNANVGTLSGLILTVVVSIAAMVLFISLVKKVR